MFANVRRLFTVRRPAVVVSRADAAAPTLAHRPVLVGGQPLPWLAPTSRDGGDKVVFVGRLDRAWTFRWMRVQVRAGRPLHIELFVPDLTPENSLPLDRLPRALVVQPRGRATLLRPILRVPFTDPDNGHRYLLLHAYESAPAAGTYAVLVTGRAPARFAVAHGGPGATASHFAGVRHGTVATPAQVTRWYVGD